MQGKCQCGHKENDKSATIHAWHLTHTTALSPRRPDARLQIIWLDFWRTLHKFAFLSEERKNALILDVCQAQAALLFLRVLFSLKINDGLLHYRGPVIQVRDFRHVKDRARKGRVSLTADFLHHLHLCISTPPSSCFSPQMLGLPCLSALWSGGFCPVTGRISL